MPFLKPYFSPGTTMQANIHTMTVTGVNGREILMIHIYPKSSRECKRYLSEGLTMKAVMQLTQGFFSVNTGLDFFISLPKEVFDRYD